MADDNLTLLKTKLRTKYECYSKIQVLFRYKMIIDRLSKNQSICIMKQDKACDDLAMDKSKYTAFF